MRAGKICCLIAILFCLSACSQVTFDETEQQVSSVAPLGSYTDYSAPQKLRYYKSVLSPQKWREQKVLNYSKGYFPYPPPSGYRVLHYRDSRTFTQIDLHREIVNDDTFAQVIEKRGASDHCRFTSRLHRKFQDMEIAEVSADHYVWLYGDYLCKYYFVKAGNVVYTFRLLSPAKQYIFDEPDFEFFVKDNIENYLVYSPRQQLSPTPTEFAAAKSKGKKEPFSFSKRELISFFTPGAFAHNLPQ